MIGLLEWRDPREGTAPKRAALRERDILHMHVICAEIVCGPKTPESVLKRRIQKAAKRLRKLGIVHVIMPEDFTQTALLGKCGLRPLSTLSLRRSLASEVVRAQSAALGCSPSSVKIAVSGEQMTGELVRTVTELSLGNRYVLLDVPYGGEELCRQLRREYGVSLLLNPSKEQLDGAEILVLFGPREDLKKQNAAVLMLYEGGDPTLPPLVLPPALEEKLPIGANREQLLTALLEAGALRPGQIAVSAAR